MVRLWYRYDIEMNMISLVLNKKKNFLLHCGTLKDIEKPIPKTHTLSHQSYSLILYWHGYWPLFISLNKII